MSTERVIFQEMAALTLRGGVPLKAVEVAGEIITIDARLCGYDAQKKCRSGEEFYAFLEAYDKVLKRAQSALAEFSAELSNTQRGTSLIEVLFDIKRELEAIESGSH